MKIGVIGLGKMGSAVAYRLIKKGFHVIGFDPNSKARLHAATYGVQSVDAVEHIPLHARILWLMLPAGEIIDTTLKQLQPYLQQDDCIIDGGNSHFSDSVRRAKLFAKKKIHFIDCGTSGGLAGKTKGFSLMVGGNPLIFQKLEPLFKAIAAPKGYGHMGPSGAGHYVKMVHNGIEYALLQAYAEGFDLLKHGSYKNLNLEKITEVWNHGSIIRSWIVHLSHAIFKQGQEFQTISGEIQESGTGQWTVQEAHAHKVPVKLIEEALAIRAWSRKTGGNYATKVVALLRHKFGGHMVIKKSTMKKKRTS